MNFFKEKLKSVLGRFWYLILIGIAVCVFMTWAQSKTSLPAYNSESGQSSRTIQKESEEKEKVKTTGYQNNDIAMTMEIPEGWEKVIKDGYDTFVHSPSASSIQIKVLPYFPRINETTEETLSSDMKERDYVLTEFEWQASNCYVVIGQKNGGSGVTDLIEKVLWDRSHVLKVTAVFDDTNYEKLKETIWTCLDSVSWDCEDPIPDGLILQYSQFGDFEFAVPASWSGNGDDTSYYAYDDETGSCMYANVSDSTEIVGEISQIDFASSLSDGKQNFALTAFQQENGRIYAEATYIKENTQTGLVQECFSNGTYLYSITYEFPLEYSSDEYTLASSALSVVRIFYVSETEEESETETEKTSIQKMSEEFNVASAVFFDDGKETEMAAGGNGTASGLTDAIVQIAGISERAAQNVSDIWDSLNAGDASDVSAYAENNDTLIIEIVNIDGVKYYAYLFKSNGSLEKITVNTQDGPEIYRAS